MTKWQNRIVGYGEEAPDQLAANPLNYRIHPASQQAAMQGALEEIGWVQNIVVNQQSGFVVDGHQRVALAMREAQPTVPVTYVELTEAEERTVIASLDQITAMAVTDDALFQELLADVQPENDALSAMLAQLREDTRTDPRAGLIVDHTAAFMGAEDIDDTKTAESTADRYANTSVRQIVMIMDVDRYAQALRAIKGIMDAQGFDNTTDVFFWMLDQLGPEEA